MKHIWGINKDGITLKEGDKIKCGNGFDTWFTHVQFDKERNCWHRESDYFNGELIGKYSND